MNETKNETGFYPGICFPSDTKFYLFVLFPGQKVFISIYHPQKALSSVELRKISIRDFNNFEISFLKQIVKLVSIQL